MENFENTGHRFPDMIILGPPVEHALFDWELVSKINDIDQHSMIDIPDDEEGIL